MTDRNAVSTEVQAGSLAMRDQQAVIDMAGAAGLAPALYIKTVMSTCFKGRTDPTAEQFAAFVMVAREHGLNPILKQIHAFPQDGGIVPIVGVDGWISQINSHPQADGMTFAYGQEDGDTYCEGTFHRKDRSHPTVIREWLSECQRPTDPWRKMPRRMLRNRVICQGARIVFGILSGVMEADEAEAYYETTAQVVQSDEAFKADMADTRKRLSNAGAAKSPASPPVGASPDAAPAPTVDTALTPEDVMAKVRACAAVPHLDNIWRKYRTTADNDGYLEEFAEAYRQRKADLRGDPIEARVEPANGEVQ